MNVGAYILARFTDTDKLLPAINNLKKCEQVLRWDAVEGHVNLIIKIKTSSTHLPEEIKKMEGVVDLKSYDILNDGEQSIIFDRKYCHSYLFIECEPVKTEKIKDFIQAMDNCLFASKVRGGCDIIAILRGESFITIDRIVNDNVRILDGIVRMKTNRVIDLKQI